LVAADLVNRRPVEILMIQYGYLTFDSEGRIDEAEREEKMRLSVDMVPPVATDRESLNVVDAEYRFAKKRYDSEHKWRPSPEIEAAIVEATFGSKT